MASEREQAKKAITNRTSDEPELDLALSQAQSLQHKLQHELAVKTEEHRHKEHMRKTELGLVGLIFGGESSASLTIAAVVAVISIIAAVGCLIMAWQNPAANDFWGKQFERSTAVAMSALAFIFGKAGRNK
jgi:hypothetical protein